MKAGAFNQKLIAVSDLIRLKNQYGTALLLLPAMWALFMASGGIPRVKYLIIFIAGSFLMRSAGCAINDLADMKFDKYVERTKTRPLADGRLTAGEAVAIFAALSLVAFTLVLFLNRLAIALSFAAVVLASSYPFVKRVSRFPQAFLGVAFGWGALMAWAAVKGTVALPAVLIFAASIFWATAYDTIYALMDIEDDIKIGVKSTAIFFGENVWTILVILYTLMAVSLIAAGLTFKKPGFFYYSGVVISWFFFLTVVDKLKRSRLADADKSNEAFLEGFRANVRGGAIILAAIIIDMNF